MLLSATVLGVGLLIIVVPSAKYQDFLKRFGKAYQSMLHLTSDEDVIFSKQKLSEALFNMTDFAYHFQVP